MVLFEVSKPPEEEIPADLPPDATRFVRYQFPPEFLQLKTVGATYVSIAERQRTFPPPRFKQQQMFAFLFAIQKNS